MCIYKHTCLISVSYSRHEQLADGDDLMIEAVFIKQKRKVL